jgi:hypothetical protein
MAVVKYQPCQSLKNWSFPVGSSRRIIDAMHCIIAFAIAIITARRVGKENWHDVYSMLASALPKPN